MYNKLIKKLTFSFVIMISFSSFSSSANLTITHDGDVSRNCVNEFDLILDTEGDTYIDAADISLLSSMEFVDFVPSGVFKYTLPPVKQDSAIRVGFFLDGGSVLVGSGNISLGKIYYKDVSTNYDGFIDFKFITTGSTVDTSVFSEGKDIITTLNGFSYVINGEDCIDAVITGGIADIPYEDYIEGLSNDVISSNSSKNNLVKILLIIGMCLLVSFIFFVIKRKRTGISKI